MHCRTVYPVITNVLLFDFPPLVSLDLCVPYGLLRHHLWQWRRGQQQHNDNNNNTTTTTTMVDCFYSPTWWHVRPMPWHVSLYIPYGLLQRHLQWWRQQQQWIASILQHASLMDSCGIIPWRLLAAPSHGVISWCLLAGSSHGVFLWCRCVVWLSTQIYLTFLYICSLHLFNTDI